MLTVSLLTSGSPTQLTGGHLYHRRLVEAAEQHRARMDFVSARTLHNPFRDVGDVALVDSLVAARVAPWAWVARRRRVSLAAIVHQPPGGVGHNALRAAIQRRLDLFFYRRCTLLIAVSAALADELVATGLRRDRICVAEPGRDGPTAAGSAMDLRRGRRIAVLCVGNWLPNKGIVELIDAVSAQSEGDVTLHLVGGTDADARYTAHVRDRLASPDLMNRVVVHGPVEPHELADMYSCADVFALASYSETYGTVYAEALAAGLPVVGWRAGNLPHLVDDGIEGSLVEPGDIAGLAHALRRLATEPGWRASLAAGARRRGERLPTWADTAATVFDALSRLAPARG